MPLYAETWTQAVNRQRRSSAKVRLDPLKCCNKSHVLLALSRNDRRRRLGRGRGWRWPRCQAAPPVERDGPAHQSKAQADGRWVRYQQLGPLLAHDAEDPQPCKSDAKENDVEEIDPLLTVDPMRHERQQEITRAFTLPKALCQPTRAPAPAWCAQYSRQ